MASQQTPENAAKPKNGQVSGSSKLATAAAAGPFASFLENNPVSQIGEPNAQFGHGSVNKPWGDDTIIIRIPRDPAPLAAVLNNVILPERYTAIWHRDTRLLEVIYTAFPFLKEVADIATRRFHFDHDGKRHLCRFDDSSDRLLVIADHFLPIAPIGSTYYRNLSSYRNYLKAKRKEPNYQEIPNARPVSFWIEGIEWSDDGVLDLVNHLNFYMAYFDNMSPTVLVHSPRKENIVSQPQRRLPLEVFPKEITSRRLDNNLLLFGEAARSGDPIRRFFYNYQILEYASTHYIEDDIRQTIKRTLARPHATADLEKLTDDVIAAYGPSKIDDYMKVVALLRETVNPDLVWREIQPNSAIFSAPMKFDGDFEIEALIRDKWTVEDFKTGCFTTLPSALRKIRNALAHGKDQRTSGVIQPTAANFERLQPWVSVITVIAREAMIYANVM